MASSTAIGRRSALRLATSAGVAGLVALGESTRGAVRASHVHDLKAIDITWLDYTDSDGKVLGRIRPNVMLDISNHRGLVTPEDRRDLWLHVSIRNTGGAEFVVEPTALALWTTAGYLHRPLEERPRGYMGNVLDDFDQGEHALVPGSGALQLTSEPIAPRTDRNSNILFRIPADVWLAGLVFTPEPERILVLARFPPDAGPIIID
jgi:hypothetical protein